MVGMLAGVSWFLISGSCTAAAVYAVVVVVAYHYGISAGRDLVPDHVVVLGSFFWSGTLGG